MRFPVNRALPLAALILLGGGAAAMAASRTPQPVAPVTGPAADYPVVIGPPFTVDGTVWTPSDQLNYDAVGNAALGVDTGSGVTAAHKTLPLPSYAEVTSLSTGRTILVRIERRGPMTNDALIALSPDAAAQLGAGSGSTLPVRVRRVNPPEQERAMLRSGGRAPDRMETPEGLLKVLRRKLADQSPLTPPPSTPPAMPQGQPLALPVAKPPVADTAPPTAQPVPKAVPTPKPQPKPAAPAQTPSQRKLPVGPTAEKAPPPRAEAVRPEASRPANRGSTFVQVAAFSSESSARKVAAQLGGTVSASGKFWRVRLGPYPNRAKAAPALEKAKGAGYRDARILGAD